MAHVLFRFGSAALVLSLIVAGGCGGGGHKGAVSEWDDDPRLDASPRRGVDAAGVLRSPDEPPISFKMDPDLRYVGNIVFVLKDRSRVDRHHFVDAARDGRIRRMVVMQFEAALPGSDLTYDDGERNPMSIAGQTFSNQTSFFSNHAAVAESPEAEAARTTAFLDSRGLWLDDELVSSRFVAVLNEDHTQELVIYYIEPAADIGFELADFEAGGRGEAARDEVDAALTSRALAAFNAPEE